MQRFIFVNAVNGNTGPSHQEEDDLGNVIVHASEETTASCAINVEHIRSFNVRKGERVGTRIVFINGTALPVTETMEEVTDKIAALNG